jgi:hypothetical protein
MSQCGAKRRPLADKRSKGDRRARGGRASRRNVEVLCALQFVLEGRLA